MLGSGARPVGAVCGRLAGRVGTAGVHAAVGGWARAVGRAPESLDDRRWPDGQLDLPRLSAGEVGAFVVAQSRKRPRSVGRIVTALRSLLGFLHVDGVID